MGLFYRPDGSRHCGSGEPDKNGKSCRSLPPKKADETAGAELSTGRRTGVCGDACASALSAAKGADDIDGVDDDAGARVNHDGVAIVVTPLIAVGNGRQCNDDLLRHGAKALLPARRQDLVAVVLFAETGWKVAWAVVVADEVGVVLIAEVALVVVFAIAIAIAIAIAVPVVVSVVALAATLSVAMALVVAIVAVSMVAAVALRLSVGRRKDEACCYRSEQYCKVSSIQWGGPFGKTVRRRKLVVSHLVAYRLIATPEPLDA